MYLRRMVLQRKLDPGSEGSAHRSGRVDVTDHVCPEASGIQGADNLILFNHGIQVLKTAEAE